MSVIEELKEWLDSEHKTDAFHSARHEGDVSMMLMGSSEAYKKSLKKIEELEAGGERMNYFISYAWYKLDDTGFGNCDFNAKSKITQIEHLREIEKIIKDRNNKDRNNFAQVVILNWKELGVSK